MVDLQEIFSSEKIKSFVTVVTKLNEFTNNNEVSDEIKDFLKSDNLKNFLDIVKHTDPQEEKGTLCELVTHSLVVEALSGMKKGNECHDYVRKTVHARYKKCFFSDIRRNISIVIKKIIRDEFGDRSNPDDNGTVNNNIETNINNVPSDNTVDSTPTNSSVTNSASTNSSTTNSSVTNSDVINLDVINLDVINPDSVIDVNKHNASVINVAATSSDVTDPDSTINNSSVTNSSVTNHAATNFDSTNFAVTNPDIINSDVTNLNTSTDVNKSTTADTQKNCDVTSQTTHSDGDYTSREDFVDYEFLTEKLNRKPNVTPLICIEYDKFVNKDYLYATPETLSDRFEKSHSQILEDFENTANRDVPSFDPRVRFEMKRDFKMSATDSLKMRQYCIENLKNSDKFISELHTIKKMFEEKNEICQKIFSTKLRKNTAKKKSIPDAVVIEDIIQRIKFDFKKSYDPHRFTIQKARNILKKLYGIELDRNNCVKKDSNLVFGEESNAENVTTMTERVVNILRCNLGFYPEEEDSIINLIGESLVEDAQDTNMTIYQNSVIQGIVNNIVKNITLKSIRLQKRKQAVKNKITKRKRRKNVETIIESPFEIVIPANYEEATMFNRTQVIEEELSEQVMMSGMEYSHRIYDG